MGLTELRPGMDFRTPALRRGVFHRFYQFHLKYRAHPGAVYYVLPYLAQQQGWGPEEALWFAFLNGNTQHPVTSWILHRRFPSVDAAEPMLEWYRDNYARLAFDTDRRHHKKMLPQAVEGYRKLLRGRTQADLWGEAAQGGFSGIWAVATAIPSFGRLSAFSFSEYLRISRVPFDCDTLFLDDRSGSKSHRNGLCKVLGRDDLDWHSTNPGFDGTYSKQTLGWLEAEGASILAEARELAAGTDYQHDVSYFTLESALCTYKSWHRVNRRYPNVYNDMFHDRIRATAMRWPGEDLSVFWEARRRYLPDYLRLEDNPHDPGCVPLKQNHYRLTGQVIMMDRDYPEFRNDFNDAVRDHVFPRWR